MASKAIPVMLALALAGGLTYAFTRKAKASTPQEGMATLYGIITDAETGLPLAGVALDLDGLKKSSDSAGYYAFNNIPTGTYTLMLDKNGYISSSQSVSLAEGMTEVNIQMEAEVQVAPPFTFSNVSAQRVTMNTAPAFATIIFYCTINNLNSVAATHTINVRAKVWDSYHSVWGDFGVLNSFSLSLSPGQSSTFKWDGNVFNTGWGLGPQMSQQQTLHMWLEDEGGNKSAEGVA
jgi:hypothetical protein